MADTLVELKNKKEERADQVRRYVDEYAALALEADRIKQRMDWLKGQFETMATVALKDTKLLSISYWGSQNSRVTVTNTATVKPISLTMVKKVLGEVAGDFVKSETVDKMTESCKRLLAMVCQGNFTMGSLEETIRAITSDAKIQATLRKKLKGRYEKDKALLEKVATRVVEEYYSCPMVMRLLLLFLHPCRDWNNRVLLLNFFLDNDCCAMLLAADSRESTDARLEETVHEQGLEAAARIYYRRYCDGYACVWEEREDVMEMILRYFEKSRGALRKGDSAVVVNGFLFQMLHYIACKLPRYQFFTRSLESLFDSIHVSRLLE
mgnify:CR=1 FL=1